MMRTFYILSLTICDLAILASHILLELYVWIYKHLKAFRVKLTDLSYKYQPITIYHPYYQPNKWKRLFHWLKNCSNITP